jgi:hypothetical protein
MESMSSGWNQTRMSPAPPGWCRSIAGQVRICGNGARWLIDLMWVRDPSRRAEVTIYAKSASPKAAVYRTRFFYGLGLVEVGEVRAIKPKEIAGKEVWALVMPTTLSHKDAYPNRRQSSLVDAVGFARQDQWPELDYIPPNKTSLMLEWSLSGLNPDQQKIREKKLLYLDKRFRDAVYSDKRSRELKPQRNLDMPNPPPTPIPVEREEK